MEPDEKPDYIEYRICDRRSDDNSDVWHGPWRKLPKGQSDVKESVRHQARSFFLRDEGLELYPHKAVWIEKREVRMIALPYEEITP